MAREGLRLTNAINYIVLCLCRVNLWYRGACLTRQTGTMAGGACLGGWTGMGTSPPPRQIPRWVIGQICVVHVLDWSCTVRLSLAVTDTSSPNTTKLSGSAGA